MAGIGRSRQISRTASNPSISGSHEERQTILFVEDNTEVRAYVRRHLEPNYRVLEAENGK